MAAEFEVFTGKDGKTHGRLQADNNEIVAESEAYESKAGALKGIDSVKRIAADAPINDRTGE